MINDGSTKSLSRRQVYVFHFAMQQPRNRHIKDCAREFNPSVVGKRGEEGENVRKLFFLFSMKTLRGRGVTTFVRGWLH